MIVVRTKSIISQRQKEKKAKTKTIEFYEQILIVVVIIMVDVVYIIQTSEEDINQSWFNYTLVNAHNLTKSHTHPNHLQWNLHTHTHNLKRTNENKIINYTSIDKCSCHLLQSEIERVDIYVTSEPTL